MTVDAVEFGELKGKLSSMVDTLESTNKLLRDQASRQEKTLERIVVLEQTVTSAHTRLDDVKKNLNEDIIPILNNHQFIHERQKGMIKSSSTIYGLIAGGGVSGLLHVIKIFFS